MPDIDPDEAGSPPRTAQRPRPSSGSSSTLSSGRSIRDRISTARRRVNRRLSDTVAAAVNGGRKPNRDKCRPHGRERCYQCIHFVHVGGSSRANKDGDVDVTRHIDSEASADPAIAYPPQFARARFVPATDSQMRPANADELGLRASVLKLGGGTAPTNPRYLEPKPEWFVFCAKCHLTYLVGADGRAAAQHHPSHCAKDNKRTVVVWVEAAMREDAMKNHIGTYRLFCGREADKHYDLSAPSEIWNWWWRSDSRKQGVHDVELHLTALRHSLVKILSSDILAHRNDEVRKHEHSNSHAFKRDAKQFRLLVFTPLTHVDVYLQTLEWRPSEMIFATADGTLLSRSTSVLVRQLSSAILDLAAKGIDVAFFHTQRNANDKAKMIMGDKEPEWRWHLMP